MRLIFTFVLWRQVASRVILVPTGGTAGKGGRAFCPGWRGSDDDVDDKEDAAPAADDDAAAVVVPPSVLSVGP